jgi:hypothetical protein
MKSVTEMLLIIVGLLVTLCSSIEKDVPFDKQQVTHQKIVHRKLSDFVLVTNELQLQNSIASNTVVEFKADIFVNETILIEGIESLEIVGHGHKLDAQGKMGCLYVAFSTISLHNLTLSNGNSTVRKILRHIYTNHTRECKYS